MNKYTLKKKWHPSQVEEVGHVFEEDTFDFSITSGKSKKNLEAIICIYPHEIALLCEAGYLEQEKKCSCGKFIGADGYHSATKCTAKEFITDPQLDLWTEEPPGGTRYWSLKYSDDLEEETVGWEWYTFSKISRLFHLYNLHTKNCHKTQKSAEEALKRLLEPNE